LIFDDPAEQEDRQYPQFRFFQVYSIVLVTKLRITIDGRLSRSIARAVRSGSKSDSDA
jgi:hypothetical protein